MKVIILSFHVKSSSQSVEHSVESTHTLKPVWARNNSFSSAQNAHATFIYKKKVYKTFSTDPSSHGRVTDVGRLVSLNEVEWKVT